MIEGTVENPAALMEAVARERDRDAFGRLFAHYAPRLKTYMIQAGADPSKAEDLVQEVMLAVWCRAESFDPRKAAVSTWIFTIARNRRIDSLRRERRPELDPDDPALVPVQPLEAAQLLEIDERERELRSAMAGLPPEQADVLHGFYLEGRSHTDIAASRKIPLGTVKSRIRIAVNRLRDALSRQEGGT